MRNLKQQQMSITKIEFSPSAMAMCVNCSTYLKRQIRKTRKTSNAKYEMRNSQKPPFLSTTRFHHSDLAGTKPFCALQDRSLKTHPKVLCLRARETNQIKPHLVSFTIGVNAQKQNNFVIVNKLYFWLKTKTLKFTCFFHVLCVEARF